MPAQYTLPPDTRVPGGGNPPGDMNAVVDALTAMGAGFNVLNAAYAGGARGDGVTDDTAAIQAALSALPGGGTLVVPPTPSGYLISTPLTCSQNAVTITGGGWAQTASTAGPRIFASAGFTGSALLNVTGEGTIITGITIDAANHAGGMIVTGQKVMLHHMQVRSNTSATVGIDLQAGSASAYLDTVNINSVNGGTCLQVGDTDLIMSNCKPQNGTVDVVLLTGASGALLQNNHWTAGSGKQNCVQISGNASHVGIIGNRFDNYVFSAIQLTPAAGGHNNVLICNNVFHSTMITDATYAVIGVDTTTSSCRGLQIVGNAGYATGTNRPLYGLAAQTQAGAAATNPTRLASFGTVFNSNNFWASSAMFGPSSSPTIARGNILTTDGTTYAAVTDI